MRTNLNSIYHKGKFCNGERAKHLRPYGKRTGNKRFRKTGKNNDAEITDNLIKWSKQRKTKKSIKVKITYYCIGDSKSTHIKRFRSIRDAENSMRRNNVIRSKIID